MEVQPKFHSSTAERVSFRPEELRLVVSPSSDMRPLKSLRSRASHENAGRAATRWHLAGAGVARWVHDYNNARPQSSLGYQTPATDAEALRPQHPSTLRHGESSASKTMRAGPEHTIPTPRF